MIHSARTVIRLMAIGVFIAALSACQKQEAPAADKGPAEQAGEKLDQAASRAGEELNKAADAAGKGLQQLGQKIQNAADETQESQKKE